MEGRQATFADRSRVLGGPVTLIMGQPIARIGLVSLAHERVALDFCQHGSGGNTGDFAIAFYYGLFLRPECQRAPVQQDDIRFKAQASHRLAHRLLQGKHDAVGVDDVSRNVRHMPGARTGAQRCRDFLTALLAELLGIVEMRDLTVGIKHAGPGAYRASQRPAPYLVNASHHHGAGAIKLPFIGKERPEALLFLLFNSLFP